MRVTVKEPITINDEPADVGSVVTLPGSVARRYLAAGIVEPAPDDAPVTATKKRSRRRKGGA